ncbi:MAG: hypothetical protein IPI65_17240 [Bacteroidetes bacterium]|nr:hypothetical protein [Bacteroidota bacterium]
MSILRNLNDVSIDNQLYKKIIDEYYEYYEHNEFLPQVYFTHHENEEIKKLAIDILQFHMN